MSVRAANAIKARMRLRKFDVSLRDFPSDFFSVSHGNVTTFRSAEVARNLRGETLLATIRIAGSLAHSSTGRALAASLRG